MSLIDSGLKIDENDIQAMLDGVYVKP